MDTLAQLDESLASWWEQGHSWVRNYRPGARPIPTSWDQWISSLGGWLSPALPLDLTEEQLLNHGVTSESGESDTWSRVTLGFMNLSASSTVAIGRGHCVKANTKMQSVRYLLHEPHSISLLPMELCSHFFMQDQSSLKSPVSSLTHIRFLYTWLQLVGSSLWEISPMFSEGFPLVVPSHVAQRASVKLGAGIIGESKVSPGEAASIALPASACVIPTQVVSGGAGRGTLCP